MGGFTRLLNTPNAKADKLMDEIPTLLVRQLSHGRCDECDHGFIVMNRPWGAVQFVETDYFEKIPEEYLFIIETDHIFLTAPPNLATPDSPVAFGFYYMISTDPKLRPTVRRFLNPEIDISSVDNVGPSPLLTHKKFLTRIARPWWDLSLKLKNDWEANRDFGWVLEMWAYTIAARNLGVRHMVSKDIQVEPQGGGTDELEGKWIFHYTFGQKEGDWKLDKRIFSSMYPPVHIKPPPRCKAKSLSLLPALWSEAAETFPDWKNKQKDFQTSEDVSPIEMYLKYPRETGVLGERLRGTGPWNWGSLDNLFFFSRGIAFVVLGEKETLQGLWNVTRESSVHLFLCGKSYKLDFEDASAPWEFKASDLKTGNALSSGKLTKNLQKTAEILPLTPGISVGSINDKDTKLVHELAGSGPWSWAGNVGMGFMRGGQLLTPWGMGTWGTTRQAGAKKAADDTIFADFASNEHTITFMDRECLVMSSKRARDNELVRLNLVDLKRPDKLSATCAPHVEKIISMV